MRFVLSAAFLTTIFGCGIMSLIFGMPDRYIKRDVQANELVGTWSLTSDSETRIAKWKKDFPDWGIVIPWKEITFKQDGTCDLSESPCSWAFTKMNSLEENKDVPGIIIYEGQSANAIGTNAYSLYLFEENGELSLWTFIGDPDDFSLQEFKKSAK